MLFIMFAFTIEKQKTDCRALFSNVAEVSNDSNSLGMRAIRGTHSIAKQTTRVQCFMGYLDINVLRGNIPS